MPEGYRLGAAGFVPVPSVPLLPAPPDHNVIDSFLLVDGVVSGLGLHIDRFVRSVSGFVPLGVSAAELESMVRACLPQVGEWFPRLECHAVDRGGPCEVYLWVRPAPARRAATRLWVPAGSDPRERPEIKGWDLPALMDMRAEAVRQGADDVLLLAAATGDAIETTTGALVAWVGDPPGDGGRGGVAVGDVAAHHSGGAGGRNPGGVRRGQRQGTAPIAVRGG